MKDVNTKIVLRMILNLKFDKNTEKKKRRKRK